MKSASTLTLFNKHLCLHINKHYDTKGLHNARKLSQQIVLTTINITVTTIM